MKDSAIAVDRFSGYVYFADNTQPLYAERPQAEIYVYDSTNTYQGHLKFNVIDALPVGLAIDNSTQPTQGRVYVTSGNTTGASVYAYGIGAGTFALPLPPIGAAVTMGANSGAEGTGSAAAQGVSSGQSPLTAPNQAASSPLAPPASAIALISSATPPHRAKRRHTKRHHRVRHHHHVSHRDKHHNR